MEISLVTSSQNPALTHDDALVARYLSEQGVKVTPLPWECRDVDWTSFDAVITRSCWNYHLHHGAFRDWLRQLRSDDVFLWNSADVTVWNMDKVYLRELSLKGIPVVPTVWIGTNDVFNLQSILQEHHWARAVVKPTVSASAHNTWATSPSRAKADQVVAERIASETGIMVQPLLGQVESFGEWSFIFFNKRFSHAVVKRAKANEFRIQSEFGGSIRAEHPERSMIEAACRVIDAIQEPLLFARVDGIEVDGQLVLMELELIEPDLFLRTNLEAPKKFAQVILELEHVGRVTSRT